jgi:uncharacterized protein (UPF0333 family)
MSVPTVQPDNGNQQVFQPVPTHDDIRDLSQQVRAAKSGQAKLLVAVIFLAGVVAAGAVAMAMMNGNANQQVAAAEQELAVQVKKSATLEEQLDQKDQVIATQAATLDSYADFQSIIALQAQAATLESEITALLAQPSRSNAPARLKQMPADVEWLDDVVSALADRRDELLALKMEVEAWPPVPARVRPD